MRPGGQSIRSVTAEAEKVFTYALAREPGNEAASRRLPEVTGHDPAKARVTTLGEEKQFNTFMRLGSSSVIATLRASFPELPERPDPQTVFAKLRELRNTW